MKLSGPEEPKKINFTNLISEKNNTNMQISLYFFDIGRSSDCN